MDEVRISIQKWITDWQKSTAKSEKSGKEKKGILI